VNINYKVCFIETTQFYCTLSSLASLLNYFSETISEKNRTQ